MPRFTMRVLGRVSRLRALELGLCLVQLSTGCGDDDESPPAEVVKHRDAGTGSEPFDGSVPRPRADAGKVKVPDGTPAAGLTGECASDSNKIFTVTERDAPFLDTPLAVDPVRSRFALPFVSTDGCLEAVQMTTLTGAATGGAPKQAMAIDQCSKVLDAVVTAAGSSWLVGVVDNREPPYDVWIATYDQSTAKSGKAKRLSQSSAVENAVALTTLRDGQRVLVAFADEERQVGQALYVRPLDATGTAVGEAVQIDQSSTLYFHGLSIKALGLKGAGLAYWRYSLDYTTSELVFVTLDESGKPVREAWVVAGNAGPSASIDLASDEEGGGIVYSRAEAQTGRQVWFQQVDLDGQAAIQRNGSSRAPALRIVNSAFPGIDVSMTKLRASYLIAYRALAAPMQPMPTIRMYFLDRYGAVIGSSDVSYTSNTGGRTAIQSANDGRVVVGWSEVDGDGTSAVKVARLPCVGG